MSQPFLAKTVATI